MTERAAVEALASVPRVQERASCEDSGADDEDEDEPRRKRVKRGASGNTAASLARRRSSGPKFPPANLLPRIRVVRVTMLILVIRGEGEDLSAISFLLRAVQEVSRSSSHAAFHTDRYGRGYTVNLPSLHSAPHVGGFNCLH